MSDWTRRGRGVLSLHGFWLYLIIRRDSLRCGQTYGFSNDLSIAHHNPCQWHQPAATQLSHSHRHLPQAFGNKSVISCGRVTIRTASTAVMIATCVALVIATWVVVRIATRAAVGIATRFLAVSLIVQRNNLPRKQCLLFDLIPGSCDHLRHFQNVDPLQEIKD